jgi:hypothetical protein
MTALRHAVLVFVVTFVCESLGAEDSRKPWEWSDEERIAARADATQAAARTRRAAGVSFEVTAPTKPYDIIDGKRDAHLMLEFEVFEHMLRMAFADDALTRQVYRASKEAQRQQAGLPSDFWQQMEVISAPYRASYEAHRLQARGDASDEPLSTAVCRDRFRALTESRERFGTALSRFLYIAVAPSITEMVVRRPDTARLRVLSRGCP